MKFSLLCIFLLSLALLTVSCKAQPEDNSQNTDSDNSQSATEQHFNDAKNEYEKWVAEDAANNK